MKEVSLAKEPSVRKEHEQCPFQERKYHCQYGKECREQKEKYGDARLNDCYWARLYESHHP
jgi:uncharacterized protein YecT (DUF1311 family)